MDRSQKVTYQPGLQPKSMTSIQIALTEFSAVLNRDNYASLLQDFFGKPYIMEFVLSGISKTVNDWILEDFHSEPESFEDSFSGKILGQLANFFFLYSSSADEKTASSLRDCHRTVKLAREVIQTLNGRAKGSQKEKGNVRLGIQRHDKALFTELQLQEPKNRVEADKLCQKLLVLMRDILGVYLTSIRRVEVIEFVKSMVIRQMGPEAIAVTELQTTEDDQCAAAFPRFLPMKVAFHFDTPDDFGTWRILLGSQAQRDLRTHQQGKRKLYAAIMTKMKELSKGNFSPDNQTPITGSGTDVPIFVAEVPESEDLRIVYSVDCVTDYDNQSEVQALRIFGFFPLGQIDRSLWKSVSRFLTNQGEVYRERCLVRTLETDSGDLETFLPAIWSNPNEIDELSASEPIDYLSNLPPDDANQLHHIISLEKYVILSKALLESIDANRIANFPFEVSKHERHIIQHNLSCYVLGRSGTGKTTTMLFKMLLIERAHQLSDGSQPPPRQMFVTKSKVLAGKVNEHFKTFLMSLSFAADIEPPSSNNEDPADENIVHEEDNTTWRNDLPEKFTELEDRHFPLFITFDHLCKMIEADIQDTGARHRSPITTMVLEKGKGRFATTMRQLANFDRFLAAYWHHFPERLTKNFDPLPVFNEIMGVISGSEGTLQFRKGYLERQAYSELSSRMHPTFADHRNELYDLFEAYLKRKQDLQDFDFPGRTHDIIRFVDKKLSNVQKLSHLYVDETQDNLLIDTYLLRLICRNTDGLFWAGDTAQTISAGSSFSFNTLKAFQHRVQIKLFEKRMSNIRVKEPKMFYLSVNYRSHAGIVNCAQSVIDVLQRFWQDSIDSLPKERGNAPGAKPLFYTTLSSEFVRECRFLSCDSVANASENIELGAHQCILVRDEKAKAKLSSEVGREVSRNISTLYDTKGLEFNDVILYNFFHDSLVEEGDWRIVLHEASCATNCSTPFTRLPQYDNNRHATLCSELKSLYVAVTRARNNLRIVDESKKGEPMRALWESRDQVISCKLGEEPTEFAKPSIAGDWAQRARMYFDNQNWLQAFHCYEKAGKIKAAAIANAYHLRQKARQMPTQTMDSASAFASAGEAFVKCGEATNKIDHKNSYLKLGAQCYHDGGHILRAAKIYCQGNWLLEAVNLFHELRRFDNIFAILTKPLAPSTIRASIRDETRLHYISKKDYRKSRQLFKSDEEHLQYLADRDLDINRAEFLLYLGRMGEGVEFLLSKSRTIEAIELCLRNEKDKDASAKRAKGIIFESLWQRFPFGVAPIGRKETNKLCDCSTHISLDENELEEIRMFRTIASGRHAELVQLASSFVNWGNLEAAALCFDHYFSRFPQLIQGERDMKEIADHLQQFSDYVGILQDLAFMEDPVHDSRACKLFGIQPVEKDRTVVLSRESLLYSHIWNKRSALTIPIKGKIILHNEEFIKVFHECLQARLLDRVTTENDACLHAPALRDPPCLKHLLSADCDPSTCNLSHVPPDLTWSENWIRAHLLQIVIYQSISRIQDEQTMRDQRRYWFIKLYEALVPVSHLFGSTFTVINDITTAFPKAMTTALEWARAMSIDLPYLPKRMFLTLAMQIADFAFAFDEGHPELYIDRPPFTASPCAHPYSNGLDGNNIVQEMLRGLDLGGPSSLIMGISFIEHVVERRIPINLHVFCSFIERVCALLIVCDRLQQFGNLHSVLLPRSWLKRVLDRLDVEKAKVQDCRFWQLLRPVKRLIHSLHPSTPSHIRATSQYVVGPNFRDFGRLAQGSITRALFIARLCRVVGLLGCNIHVKQFRSDIITIFTSIQRDSNFEFSPLYALYFDAKTFADIHRATSQSMHGGVFDGMIKLRHTNFEPVPEVLPVRNLVYSTADELLLLRVGHISSSVNAAQYEYEPAPLEFDPGLEQEDDLEHEIDAGNPQPTSVSDHQRHSQDIPPPTELPEKVIPIFGDRETRAAFTIQEAFRSFLVRRRNVIDDNRQADQAHESFIRYKDTLQPDMLSLAPGSSVRYSIFYLGPLPELLDALEAIWDLLGKKKGWLKKRLTQISGNEQAEVNATLTGINNAMKALKRLRQQIEPGGKVHSDRNIGRLTKKVEEIYDFIETIHALVQIPEDLQGSLDIVYKAFLQERSLPPQKTHQSQGQRARHPPLVMEDTDDSIQEAHKV